MGMRGRSESPAPPQVSPVQSLLSVSACPERAACAPHRGASVSFPKDLSTESVSKIVFTKVCRTQRNGDLGSELEQLADALYDKERTLSFLIISACETLSIQHQFSPWRLMKYKGLMAPSRWIWTAVMFLERSSNPKGSAAGLLDDLEHTALQSSRESWEWWSDIMI